MWAVMLKMNGLRAPEIGYWPLVVIHEKGWQWALPLFFFLVEFRSGSRQRPLAAHGANQRPRALQLLPRQSPAEKLCGFKWPFIVDFPIKNCDFP